MINTTENTEISMATKLERLGAGIIRYGLVILLLWIGMFKFTAYESEGVKKLAGNSPLLSWVYSVMSVRGFSMVLGSIEIILGILIASRTVSPKASAIGSIGAIVMFLTTLSFIFSTPGVWQPGYGFPFLSPNPGQFLLKDIVLMGSAIWTAGEALKASNNSVSSLNKMTTATNATKVEGLS